MTTQTLIGTKYEHNGKIFYEFDSKLYLFDCTGIHYLSPAAPQANGVFYSNEEYIQEDPEGLIASIGSESLRKKMSQKREEKTLLNPIGAEKVNVAEPAQQTFPRKDVVEEFEVLDKDVFKPVDEKKTEDSNKPMKRFVDFVNTQKNNFQLQAKTAEG